MKPNYFNVVFHGEIAAGQNIEEVKRKLSALFKKDAAQIEIIFSSKPMVIKQETEIIS